MQREEDLLLVLFEIQSNNLKSSRQLLQLQNIYFRALQSNKIPHLGDHDEAKSS